MKQVVISKEHYDMHVEQHEGYWFFHVDIHKWTPSVKRKYMEDLEAVYAVFNPLYAIPQDVDKKRAKFGDITGFYPIGECVCNDGRTRSIYEYKGVQ